MTFISYTKCPKCWKVAELETTTIRTKLSDLEKKQRVTTKRMVKDLLGKKTPSIKFPATSLPEINCRHCGFRNKVWGWTTQKGNKFTIYFPRQTFFLPRIQFVDTVAHEPGHISVGIDRNDPLPKHNKKWYWKYRGNQTHLFKKYQKFINSSESLLVKFHKSYESRYSSPYEEEYNKSILKKRKAKKRKIGKMN